MDFSALWDKVCLWAMHAGMPLVHIYHLVCSSVFLNTSYDEATGLERWADAALTPVHYLLAGSKAHWNDDAFVLEQRFDYNDSNLWVKTALCYIALPASLTVGSTIKALSYFSYESREHARKIALAKVDGKLEHDPVPKYQDLGIETIALSHATKINPPQYKRRPSELNLMPLDCKALAEVVKILSEHQIIFWADCGTCLGTYRYGGVIPWDWDIDLAILQADFHNVKKVLTASLDPSLYAVQDWSSRDKPNTYLKVYVKATGLLIDIYNFAVDPVQKTISSILSNGDCVLLPESWKIRERRFTVETPYDIVFPLKKAYFEGIELFVPNKVEDYLMLRYGKNIAPAKIYNEITGQYEKDLSHPYWKMAHAH